MSVKKYRITKNSSNFTTIPNKVLQGLTNYAALGLYVYLVSLPTGWEFYKEQLCKHANIGRDRLNALLHILEQHCLINIVQKRDAQGRFAHYDMEVDDGTNFKINNLHSAHAPFTEKPLTDNQSLVNRTYKRNNKKEIINKLLSASDDAQSRFDEFWGKFPVKKNKVRAKKIWERGKYDQMADLIFADIQKRVADDYQWRDKRFIPHASTYLSNKLWGDEIITTNTFVSPTSRSSKFEPSIRFNEVRNVTPEWKNGNPDYDRVHNVLKISNSATAREFIGKIKHCL